jgi:hypothetical protein
MTLREGQRRPGPAAGLRAVPDPVGVTVVGGGQRRRHPGPLAPAPGSRPCARARAGELEPNEIVNPATSWSPRCPTGAAHWFLRADDPVQTRELRALVRRLQRNGRQGLPALQAARCPRLQGLRPRPTGGPAARGTYWVPMAQAQKHWVQAMLNEDTYTSVPVLLRRDRLEQPAAVQPARRQLRSAARPGGGPGAPGGRPRAATAPVRPADGRPVPARRGQLGHRVRRLAALSARQRLAAARTGSWTRPPSPPAA